MDKLSVTHKQSTSFVSDFGESAGSALKSERLPGCHPSLFQRASAFPAVLTLRDSKFVHTSVNFSYFGSLPIHGIDADAAQLVHLCLYSSLQSLQRNALAETVGVDCVGRNPSKSKL